MSEMPRNIARVVHVAMSTTSDSFTAKMITLISVI